jgi:hypothetical protein
MRVILMDELKRLREAYFVNQTLKRQFSSASSQHNHSHSESVISEPNLTLEQKNTEKSASLRQSTGKLQPKVVLQFHSDSLGDSRDSFCVSKLKLDAGNSFQRRRLDFNPELTKTLTNQLRRPHQADLLSIKRDMPRPQAGKPVKLLLGPTVSPQKSEGVQELSLRPESHQGRVEASDSSQVLKKSLNRSGKILIPQFKSFSSDHSRSASTSKHVDIGDNEEPEKADHSCLPDQDIPKRVPTLTEFSPNRIASKITPNDLLLSRCRQMMAELQEIKTESGCLHDKIAKYKVFKGDSEASEKFRGIILLENQRLQASLAETKPQLMIAQKKLETCEAKLERARQLSVSLFVKKRDLEIKRNIHKEFQQKLGDISVKITAFKGSIEKLQNRTEMEKTLFIQHKEARSRGQVLDNVHCIIRDFGHCSDEEGKALLIIIAKLKEKLSRT